MQIRGTITYCADKKIRLIIGESTYTFLKKYCRGEKVPFESETLIRMKPKTHAEYWLGKAEELHGKEVTVEMSLKYYNFKGITGTTAEFISIL